MSGLKAEEEPLLGGRAHDFALVCTCSGGGPVVALVGGTGGRVGAGASGGVAADTLCDRSQRDALIEERTVLSAGKVGSVATTAWIFPNWVVMVSS